MPPLHKMLRAGGRTSWRAGPPRFRPLEGRQHEPGHRRGRERGRARLNALSVLPAPAVDADVATAVHSSGRRPELKVEITGPPTDDVLETFAIDPADLVHYASMGGVRLFARASAGSTSAREPTAERGSASSTRPAWAA